MATAADVIKVALAEVGYREKRKNGEGTNEQKYSPEVPGLEWSQGQPWCHTFISWVFRKAGAAHLAPVTASCVNGVEWFKDRGQWSKTPRVGSVVYYGPNGGTHVELVVDVTPTHIVTIGGNTTGNDKDGRYYNGDGVYKKRVPRNSSRIYGYGHPDYEPEKQSPPLLRRGSKGSAVKEWQKTLNKLGYDLEVDGDFGPLTEKATRDFQKKAKIEVDGIVGPITRKAARHSASTGTVFW